MTFRMTTWALLSLALVATTQLAAAVRVDVDAAQDIGRGEIARDSRVIGYVSGSGVADPGLEAAPQRKLQFWKKLVKKIVEKAKKVHNKFKGAKKKYRSLYEWWLAKHSRDGSLGTWEAFRKDRIFCIKSVVVEEVEQQQDAVIHANALEEAIVTACSSGNELVVDEVRDIVKKQGDAFALAKASAQARIKCGTFDVDAYECFEVEASADAYAEATLKGHADAVARAVSRCNCSSEATAETQLSASLYGKLVVEAAVKATANVCVDGAGTVKDEAWETCTSSIYGELLATAVVDALALGDCLSPLAAAGAEVEVTAEITAESTCGMRAEFIEAPAPPPPL